MSRFWSNILLHCKAMDDLEFFKDNHILLGCAFVFTLIVLFLSYHGFFHKVNVKATRPPYTEGVEIFYKFATNCTEASKFLTEVQEIAPNLDSFSIFYTKDVSVHCRNVDAVIDIRCRHLKVMPSIMPNQLYFCCDKSSVSSSDIRSSIGVVMHECVPDYIYQDLKEAGYKVGRLPSIDYAVVASCPYRSQLSLDVAVRKAYPMIKKFIRGNNICAHPIMELYTIHQVYFILPLVKQFHFYAEEASLECSDTFSEYEDEIHSMNGGISNSFPNQCCCDSVVHTLSCDKQQRAL